MPSRWWVSIPGLKPEYVRLHHIHGAVSGWFDRSPVEHSATDKPYAVSPLSRSGDGETGVEIGTLTGEAATRLLEGAQPGRAVRIGNQHRTIGGIHVLQEDTWPALMAYDGATRWRLELVTPATFRSGDRASPLPQLETILGGLARSWDKWSHPHTDPPVVAPGAAWVTDLDLRSELVTLQVRRRSQGTPVPLHLPGVLGTLDIRCDHPVSAAAVSSLVRLATYTGVGSMTRKGLGVARVTRLGRRVRTEQDRDGQAG